MSDRKSFFDVYVPLFDTIKSAVIAELARKQESVRTDDDARQMLMATVVSLVDVLVLQAVSVDLETAAAVSLVQKRFSRLRPEFEAMLARKEPQNVN